MADRPARIRLGIFVIVALCVLAGLLIFFGGDPQLFSNQHRYFIDFTEAPGIEPGTPVRKSGVRVGQVSKLQLNDDNNLVEVSVELDPQYIPHSGEQPVISRGLLNGDTAIDFMPKVNSDGDELPRGEPIPVGSHIIGVPPINPRTLFNQAQGAIPNAQDSLTRLSQALARFEQAAPKAERAFDEVAGFAKEAREFVPELRQTNQQLQSLIGSASSSISTQPQADVDEPVSLRDVLKELVILLRSVRPAADELEKLLAENRTPLTKAIGSIQEAADSTNQLLSPENRAGVTKTIKNLETTSDDLSKAIRFAALVLNGVDRTLTTFNARLVDAEKTFANINKATQPIAENAPAIVADVKTTARNLAESSAELSETFKAFRLTLKQFNNGNGTLAKFLTDPSLYNKFADAASALSATLARTTRIANDLEVFADKIARKPELLGIGGAINPSAGLKGSPVAPLPPERQPLLPQAPPIEGPPILQPIAPVPFVPLEPVPRR